MSYTKIGDVLVAQGQLPDAMKVFRDGLAIAERLAKADPGNAGWQRDLAVSFGLVAKIEQRSGEMEKARQGYQNARDIIERLMKLSPDNAILPKDLAYYDAQLAALDGR
jgi:tetratricopeptide (TPR) repeat protein